MSKGKVVTATNDLQKKYKYVLSEPMGNHSDPGFTPDLTPKHMIDLGIFGGRYTTVTDSEFPKNWFTKHRLDYSDRLAERNFFKVNASQSLSVWKKKGWIYPDDPGGWFQWYCRYFMGRRLPDEDRRQIKRWKAIRRHIAQLQKNCSKGDVTCRPVQRQALLHWGYDSRGM